MKQHQRGRPRIAAILKVTAVRLSPDDQILFRRMGGSSWLRLQLSIIRQQKEAQRGKETSI